MNRIKPIPFAINLIPDLVKVVKTINESLRDGSDGGRRLTLDDAANITSMVALLVFERLSAMGVVADE